MKIGLGMVLVSWWVVGGAFAQATGKTPAYLVPKTDRLAFHASTEKGLDVYLWDSHDFDYSNCDSKGAAQRDRSCMKNWYLSCVGSPHDCQMTVATHAVQLTAGGVYFSNPVDEYCLSLASTTWEFHRVDEKGTPEKEPFLYLLMAEGRPWMDHIGDCQNRISEVTVGMWAYDDPIALARVFEDSFVNHPVDGVSILLSPGDCPDGSSALLHLVEEYPSPNLMGNWLMVTEYENLPEE